MKNKLVLISFLSHNINNFSYLGERFVLVNLGNACCSYLRVS